jgi:hypothetical protein
MAVLAFYKRVRKSTLMPRMLPYKPMGQMGRLHSFYIAALVHHASPPSISDILFQLDAERA